MPKTDDSLDLLRRESKDLGMATLMSIAIAMGIIEGKHVYENLFHLFQQKLNNTLKARGQLKPF